MPQDMKWYDPLTGRSTNLPGINVLDYIPVALHKDIRSGDSIVDVTTYVQDAVDAAAGKRLIVPAGKYVLSASLADACIFLPTAGISIRGDGRHQAVFHTTSQAAHFAGVDCDYIDIEGIGLDGEQVANLDWQTGIVLRGCVHIRIVNNWLYRIGRGAINICQDGFGGSDQIPNGTRQSRIIHVQGNLFEACWGTVGLVTKFISVLDASITGNIFNSCCTIAISVESEGSTTEYGDRCDVSNNIITDCNYEYSSGFSAVSYGISIAERLRNIICNNNVITAIFADTLGAGIVISTSPSQSDTEVRQINCNGNVISGISALTGRAHAILWQAGDTSISGFTCNSNNIYDAEVGITIETGSLTATTGEISEITINSNTIKNIDEFGIWTANVSGSGELPLRNATINDNVIEDTGSHGIVVFLVDGVINSNRISNTGGSGIALLTGSLNVQINDNNSSENEDDGIVAACDDLTLLGNHCLNNGQVTASSCGIRVTAGARVIIGVNNCSDNQTGSETQAIGIRAPTTALLFRNTLSGNTSAGLFGGIQNYNTGAFDTAGNQYAAATTSSVVQGTDKSTAVTLNRGSGFITTNAANLAAGAEVHFALNNNQIVATDLIVVTHSAGGTSAAYLIQAGSVVAGSCEIRLRNITAGDLAESPIIHFAIIKAATV